MKNRGPGSGQLCHVFLVAITGVLVGAALLLLLNAAAAQGATVRISELECNTDPEVVIIVNEGDQEVDVTNWTLQSDPASEESHILLLVRALSPGESVLIQSGPSATSAFIWSREFVFRDGDATDFARLINDSGEVVETVNCEPIQVPTATPTPAQTPAPQPSPTPTVPSADGVPFGGGAPAVTAGPIPPAAMIVAGSWLLTAGLGTIAVSLLRRTGRSHPLDQE